MSTSLNQEVWFVVGSQHLYGEETLKKVASDSQYIAEKLNESKSLSLPVVFKNVVTTPDAILEVCTAANVDTKCVGLIFWMHTFSPAKMWIAGLNILNKPFAHLHTQFNKEIPWNSIDMDFMNLNQSAHGGREFGYICTRMKKARKVITGHWSDPDVQYQLEQWIRAAVGYNELKNMKLARFGDNMREVAVTEGDKVEAQIKLGLSVSGFGVGDLVKNVDAVTDSQISELIKEYKQKYTFDIPEGSEEYQSVVESVRIEIGLRTFLEEGGFKAFTTTFEDLHGLKQLPGLAVQRLMNDGYGFGAEGDWKTSAMVRAFKVMAGSNSKGTSFMEDYTYHFSPKGDKVLGAHMLEVCESIAKDKPKLAVFPLSIGGKEAPARLLFDAKPGNAVNISIIDMGDHFRLIVNKVESVKIEKDMPNLPVARVFWKPLPDLKTAATSWIYAGGAHHTVFTYDVSVETILDFAEMTGLECLVIDENSKINDFK